MKKSGLRWRQPPLWLAAAQAATRQRAAALLPQSRQLLLAITLIAGPKQIAILDGVRNEVRVVDGATYKTNETPVDAVFVKNDLYVLERDSRTLSLAGTSKRVQVDDDPAFVRESNGRLYVYSRATGIVQEITRDLAITRRLAGSPFASDFEIIGRNGYLVFPREAKLRTFSLSSMTMLGEIKVGAVPVDLASAGGNTLAIADPSAKRVWLIEGEQTLTQAIARGFIRGLLGLGLAPNRHSEFPTGVDRVASRGRSRVAYDSSTGTLYRFDDHRVTVIERNVAPGSWALTDDGIAVWDGTALRLHKIGAGEP